MMISMGCIGEDWLRRREQAATEKKEITGYDGKNRLRTKQEAVTDRRGSED